MPEYLLPDVGEGLTEAEIISWKVQVGDTVAINDVVVEIETAKSLVELPSPYAGEVAALLVAEGSTVAVGTPIIRIGAAGSAHEPIDTNIPPEGNATLVGYGPKADVVTRRARRTAAAAAPAPEPVVAEPDPEPAIVARPLAKPPVRFLARSMGIDLSTLVGSGEGGVVTREDVIRVGSDGSSSPVDDSAREWREPIKGVRKVMAEAMVASAFTAPHVTEWVSVDVTGTLEFVEALKKQPELADLKVSPLLVVAMAVSLAIRRTPEVNSTWDAAAGEVVFKRYVNLGIAAATPRGLVVPNIKGADSMGLVELATALRDLIRTAKDGRTQPADMSGGTFTITNVGVFGIDGGTPIINPGESAILCFGASRRTPWVVGTGASERIEIRDVATLALSFDHRHIDGEKGSRFLSDVAAILNSPATALLY